MALTIAAPPRATDTVVVSAGTARRPDLVWMALPATAWRGALAGRAVGATLGDDGAGAVAISADVQLVTDHRGRPRAFGNVTLRNGGTTSIGVQATLRRCDALVPACRLDGARGTSDPGFRQSADLERTAGLTWPAHAGAALTLDAVARPGNHVLATARLPWPSR